MSRVYNERLYVASYKEIFLIFVTFALILIFLFPKEILKEKLLQEESNYDLSVLYLQNMMRHDKLDEQFIMLLATRSAQVGKKDLAVKLTKLLIHSTNGTIKKEATLLRYRLLKEDYFYLQAKKEQTALEELKKELVALFNVIIQQHYYDKKDLVKWYAEALFLQEDNTAFALLEKLLAEGDTDKKLYIEGFYLAQKLAKKKEALLFVHRLEKIDRKNREKWLLSEYYFLLNHGYIKEAKRVLIEQSKRSREWKIRLAQFYVAHREYKKAFSIYKRFLRQSRTLREKKNYFKEAVKTLEAGNYMKEAADFAFVYENYFIKYKDMRTFILKLYLRANELRKAANYSKKILQMSES